MDIWIESFLVLTLQLTKIVADTMNCRYIKYNLIFKFLEDVVKLLTLSLVALLISITSQSAQAQDIEKGKTLYKACIQCHGADGMGNVEELAPKIAGQLDWYIVSSIKAFKDGSERQNPKMLPFIEGLSDQDIADLAAYISQM